MTADTLTRESVDMLATLAASLNGGRFAGRATDENVKNAALALVKPLRAKRVRESAAMRQAHKRAVAAKLAALTLEWRDYSPEDAARIDAVFFAFKRAPKRSLVRGIARRVLGVAKHTDASTCYCPECYVLGDWRATVRQYRDARRYLADVGAFALSRSDATPDTGSRFYRNVQTHWHRYAGGKHAAVHGVTPDDVFQSAMLAAIEAGDTVGGIPAFGPMYMHTRRATEAAVYLHRTNRASGSAGYSDWEWSDWEAWAKANDGNDRLAYSTNPEWLAYDAARLAKRAQERAADVVKSRRQSEATYLETSRATLAALVIEHGMTVRRIANMLGRTVDALADAVANPQDMYA